MKLMRKSNAFPGTRCQTLGKTIVVEIYPVATRFNRIMVEQSDAQNCKRQGRRTKYLYARLPGNVLGIVMVEMSLWGWRRFDA